MQDHSENQNVKLIKKSQDQSTEDTTRVFSYTIEISSTLYDQIDKHINLLKKIDIHHTMNSLTLEAIREKILAEKKGNTIKETKPKRLKFSISARLRNYIEERINALKAVRRSYSKKKWFLDAISEKLERDQDKISKSLDEFYSSKTPD